MKFLKLIPLAFLTLTACYDGDVKVDTKDITVPETPTVEYQFDGNSSTVTFQVATFDKQNPQLSKSITVNFDRQDSAKSNLKLEPLGKAFARALSSKVKGPEILKFGCDQQGHETLPIKIEAQKVHLCGNLSAPKGMSIRANYLVLQDTVITTDGPAIEDNSAITGDEKPITDLIFIASTYLVTRGKNQINLIGDMQGKDRMRAPDLNFMLGGIFIEGELEINSTASHKSYSLPH